MDKCFGCGVTYGGREGKMKFGGCSNGYSLDGKNLTIKSFLLNEQGLAVVLTRLEYF